MESRPEVDAVQSRPLEPNARFGCALVSPVVEPIRVAVEYGAGNENSSSATMTKASLSGWNVISPPPPPRLAPPTAVGAPTAEPVVVLSWYRLLLPAIPYS